MMALPIANDVKGMQRALLQSWRVLMNRTDPRTLVQFNEEVCLSPKGAPRPRPCGCASAPGRKGPQTSQKP